MNHSRFTYITERNFITVLDIFNRESLATTRTSIMFINISINIDHIFAAGFLRHIIDAFCDDCF